MRVRKRGMGYSGEGVRADEFRSGWEVGCLRGCLGGYAECGWRRGVQRWAATAS
jgi:hypothetical protein